MAVTTGRHPLQDKGDKDDKDDKASLRQKQEGETELTINSETMPCTNILITTMAKFERAKEA
jgi:hypothetical protein